MVPSILSLRTPVATVRVARDHRVRSCRAFFQVGVPRSVPARQSSALWCQAYRISPISNSFLKKREAVEHGLERSCIFAGAVGIPDANNVVADSLMGEVNGMDDCCGCVLLRFHNHP